MWASRKTRVFHPKCPVGRGPAFRTTDLDPHATGTAPKHRRTVCGDVPPAGTPRDGELIRGYTVASANPRPAGLAQVCGPVGTLDLPRHGNLSNSYPKSGKLDPKIRSSNS